MENRIAGAQLGIRMREMPWMGTGGERERGRGVEGKVEGEREGEGRRGKVWRGKVWRRGEEGGWGGGEGGKEEKM